jgi:hypothetical protein
VSATDAGLRALLELVEMTSLRLVDDPTFREGVRAARERVALATMAVPAIGPAWRLLLRDSKAGAAALSAIPEWGHVCILDALDRTLTERDQLRAMVADLETRLAAAGGPVRWGEGP